MRDVLYWLPAEQRISYRIASLVWRCLVGLAPVHLRELCCPPLSAHPSKVSFLSLLPVPPLSRSVTSPWWAPQPGTASLLNFAFLTEPLHLRFFLTLILLCLTVLVLGALLSSFLEEALYKCSI